MGFDGGAIYPPKPTKAPATQSRYPVFDIRQHANLVRGDGLRVRFSRLPGQTPKNILRAPLGLPAVLNDFTFSEESGHTEYDTIRYGEFSQPTGGVGFHGRKLIRMELETLTLDWDAKWLAHGGYDPRDVLETLRAIQHSKKAFRFAARTYQGAHAPYELDIDATLRTGERTLKSGERDARYLTLSITEWRNPSVRRRSHQPGGKHNLPTKKKLDSNDTLHSLSKHFYGTYGFWDDLRKTNGLGSWGASTPIVKSKKFHVGNYFKIPAFER